jgi:sugar phosphate isomerase/epimerase
LKLLLFRHLWGVDEALDTAFPKIKESGYDGIETDLPRAEDRARFQDLLHRWELKYIAQIFTEGSSVQEHIDSFKRRLEETQALNPRLVNCHGGRDSFSEAQGEEFFVQALKVEASIGIPVAHETHRGRILYNPWITSKLLRAFKDLKLCCDFSHWVCVCERLLEDQEDIIQQCAEHCLHIHARVGYEEGPQVSDPRAPEYQRQLEAHERWWRMIWDAQHKRGLAETTLTPEFGPPPYLHTLPHTDVPVANLWDICNWQAERQRANFRNSSRAW